MRIMGLYIKTIEIIIVLIMVINLNNYFLKKLILNKNKIFYLLF